MVDIRFNKDGYISPALDVMLQWLLVGIGESYCSTAVFGITY